ncbi:DEAD/DEAH box helicase family protein [Bacillus massiliigorillae]|uniref:DEAD/DEAH box helicase family protein n=1 Tax=Bacillus massiliigorillae TaxID=1243664 RepID=UPI0003A41352|nr:DEAD/DEAH box helicase family protein [Bacillus massiliigorillae]
MTSNIQLITKDLSAHVKESIRRANSCYILTSFVMNSGVKLLEDSLRQAAENGSDIKICTGDYLYITQPEALKRLIEIHPSIEVRLWKSRGVSFHPKAYIFENESDGIFYVGSSNMSRSALTKGVEWNVSIKGEKEADILENAIHEFLSLYYDEATISLNNETVKQYQLEYEEFHKIHPQLAKTWTKQEEIDMTLPEPKENAVLPEKIIETKEKYTTIAPRFAQVDALTELKTIQDEGYDKAMVVMATGLGKTYLAAFFSKQFKRVLFIAHLEEILFQAEQSFQKVIRNAKTGIYNGKHKDAEADVLFASIQTLSRKRHLEVFSPDDFDLIIVDEFHHAAANTYQKVLNYFTPNFLLGITATPDRNDYRDIYSICDGNVAYRIDFIEAIQRQWLAPFHYYGVYDDTDYSQIRWLGTKYDAEELAIVQLKDEVAEKILQAWLQYRQTRTIVFCSSIVQADFLSQYYNNHGYKTVSLHSQSSFARDTAIQQLAEGELDCIMTVNLFNEGVDIPTVDTLLFARPTESLTVFTQQVGRGLRIAEGKSHCVIIDLIANYRNADVKQSLFYVQNDEKKKVNAGQPIVPEGCHVEIELEAKQLLDELAKKKMPRKELVKQSYEQVKLEIGRRPSYLEVHMKGSTDSRLYKQEFKSYIHFLQWADELSDVESQTFLRYEDWFTEVEKTGMAKSYKMVLLLAMLQRGTNQWMKPISAKEVAPFFYTYLTEKEYRKRIDFSDSSSKKLWEYDEDKVASLIEKMPMTKWSGSSKGMLKLENGIFTPNFEVSEEDQAIVYAFTRQICEYRLHTYFERKSKK